jgi:hypothetical protein
MAKGIVRSIFINYTGAPDGDIICISHQQLVSAEFVVCWSVTGLTVASSKRFSYKPFLLCKIL